MFPTELTCCVGASHLLVREASLEHGLRYVRGVEEVEIKGKTLRYIICMFPEQSAILRSGRRMTMDTAFKRVRNWYELELETWDDSSNRCACCSSCHAVSLADELPAISCARVFLNSQTAEAHEAVLIKLTEIVEQDCGAPIRLAYMHGEGWDTMTVDEHRGEALGQYFRPVLVSQPETHAGVGRWALWLARRSLHPDNPFRHITAYAHLRHFYMLCLTHHKRNIKPYESRVSPEVLAAMHSLSSSEPLPDLPSTLKIIESGGKAASGVSAVREPCHGFDCFRLAEG